MNISFVTDAYKESIKHVINYCFLGPVDLGESFINDSFVSENCLGCFDDDRLVGLLYIHPYEMYFHRNIVSLGGIGVVSVLPEYRHHHWASNMLVKSLEIMKDRGYVFSALAPFSYPFYRKYGWELGFSNKSYIIPIEALKGLGAGIGQFRPLSHENRDSIDKLYKACLAKYNGAILRDENNWQARLKKIGKNRTYGYGYSAQGNGLDGYIFFSMNQGVFFIHEMVYDSLESKLELLRFVYYHSAQVKEVHWTAPLDDNTALLLDNPRFDQKVEHGMMIRVVKVKEALKSYRYPDSYKGTFTINVADQWAPWNNGSFKVTVEQGDVVVSKTDENDAHISCNINDFSQFILGYIGLEEAIELGKVTVHNPGAADDMKDIFIRHATYITDYF